MTQRFFHIRSTNDIVPMGTNARDLWCTPPPPQYLVQQPANNRDNIEYTFYYTFYRLSRPMLRNSWNQMFTPLIAEDGFKFGDRMRRKERHKHTPMHRFT